MDMAVESMEMAPEALPHPSNKDFCPPNLLFGGGGAAELFVEI